MNLRNGNQILPHFRHELKMACAETDLPLVESWVRSHRAAFRRTYPPRQVNNIYFDTHAWGSVEDSLAGVSDRAKLRLRWYGPDLCTVQGVLELKQKRGKLGRKISQPISRTLDLAAMSWRDVVECLLTQDLGPLAAAFRFASCPTIVNHYQRQYYVTADGLVRLTLDTSLAVYAQHLTPRPNLWRREPRPALLVMELKADADQFGRLSEVVAEFPLRPAAHSKYARGVLGSAFPL